MIFVTVGTHEQPFNRLIEHIDKLQEKQIIHDKVLIQTGYSTYIPKFCTYSQMFSYEEMQRNMKMANIVITHGGPSSFMEVLQNDRIPIVVPRQAKYGEHINDHQLKFSKVVMEKYKSIILVEDINDLEKYINNYNAIAQELKRGIVMNNDKFNAKLINIISEICR